MAYTPKTWRDYPNTTTPITADELNRIEQGIVGLEDYYVASEEVRRVILSKNPELALRPGELLLLQESLKWFTDFHDTPIGEHPVGMEEIWDPSLRYSMSVAYEETALSGKVLQLETDIPAYRLLKFPEPQDLSTESIENIGSVDITMKFRADQPTSVPRLAVWVAGSPFTNDRQNMHGLYRPTNPGQLTAGYIHLGNSGRTIDGNVRAFTPYQWYIMRVRISYSRTTGSYRFNVRMWNAGEKEPTGWGFRTTEALDNMTPTEVAGIYFRGPGYAEIDWVGVSWDSGKSPNPEIL